MPGWDRKLAASVPALRPHDLLPDLGITKFRAVAADQNEELVAMCLAGIFGREDA